MKRLCCYCVSKDYTDQQYIVSLEDTAHSNPPRKKSRIYRKTLIFYSKCFSGNVIVTQKDIYIDIEIQHNFFFFFFLTYLIFRGNLSLYLKKYADNSDIVIFKTYLFALPAILHLLSHTRISIIIRLWR